MTDIGIKVCKFGGSSLATSADFKVVADIIKSDDERRYIVVSAPGKSDNNEEKVTDLLIKCYDLASKKQDYRVVLDEIKARFKEIIDGLEINFDLDTEFELIDEKCSDGPGKDYLVSRGEYLNARILASYLACSFVDSEGRLMFLKKDVLDDELTDSILFEDLSELKRAVIPGFYGTGPDGNVMTFSRGGSDITGAIVSRAVHADMYENWTDVSGMLMVDPKCVENPKTISMISYSELRELTYMGATVLHEDAVFPARQAKLPINIRNTRFPDDQGTVILPKVPAGVPKHIITGIAGKKGFASSTIEKNRMNAELGFGRKVLSVLEEINLSFEHIPTGIDTMSVFVNKSAIVGKEDYIKERIQKEVDPDEIVIYENIALIAVVGRGMVNRPGVAGRIFTALANERITVKMIDQGSSCINIIIGVEEENYEKAVRAIYNEFVK